jgi:heat shock protein HtpX
MYLTLAIVFSIGFGVIYAIMFYFGFGLYVILPLAIMFFLLQWYLSPAILKATAKLRYIKDNEYPKLHNMVNELAKEAGVPVPRIAIAPTTIPNAFVFGRSLRSATLVVHEGLLNMLNDNELRSVLAHEIGHLKHNDVWVMTFVAFIPMIGWMLAQNLFFGGMFGNRNNTSTLIALGMAGFIVYFLSQLLILSLSRLRETYADEYSAVSTKHPEHLASSLLKITGANAVATQQQVAQSQTIAKNFYFVDGTASKTEVQEIENHKDDIRKLLPNIDIDAFIERVKAEKAGFGISSLFATHPPAHKRILFLAKIKKGM